MLSNFLFNFLVKIYGFSKSLFLQKIIIKLILKIDDTIYWSEYLRIILSRYHNFELGYGSYIADFDITKVINNVSIGNYSSIGSNVKFIRANHPINEFTSHPIFYNPALKYVKEKKISYTPLTIGNDVWIGTNSIILSKVTYIGDGAIIGAGSVVTKNVDPFTIVAGNPAVLRKRRFDEKIQNKLIKSNWWKLKKEDLVKRESEFNGIINDVQ